MTLGHPPTEADLTELVRKIRIRLLQGKVETLIGDARTAEARCGAPGLTGAQKADAEASAELAALMAYDMVATLSAYAQDVAENDTAAWHEGQVLRFGLVVDGGDIYVDPELPVMHIPEWAPDHTTPWTNGYLWFRTSQVDEVTL